jgi:hypothetical protein
MKEYLNATLLPSEVATTVVPSFSLTICRDLKAHLLLKSSTIVIIIHKYNYHNLHRTSSSRLVTDLPVTPEKTQIP